MIQRSAPRARWPRPSSDPPGETNFRPSHGHCRQVSPVESDHALAEALHLRPKTNLSLSSFLFPSCGLLSRVSEPSVLNRFSTHSLATPVPIAIVV
eukprot:scaffold682_cov231-Pinguiococcus_pyrenoidosus.AAC.3